MSTRECTRTSGLWWDRPLYAPSWLWTHSCHNFSSHHILRGIGGAGPPIAVSQHCQMPSSLIILPPNPQYHTPHSHHTSLFLGKLWTNSVTAYVAHTFNDAFSNYTIVHCGDCAMPTQLCFMLASSGQGWHVVQTCCSPLWWAGALCWPVLVPQEVCISGLLLGHWRHSELHSSVQVTHEAGTQHTKG